MNADIITLSPESLNLIWLILFVVLLVIELLTVGLTTIWFAAGSLAAFLADCLGAGSILHPADLHPALGAETRQPEADQDKLRERDRQGHPHHRESRQYEPDRQEHGGRAGMDRAFQRRLGHPGTDILEAGTKAKVVDISGVKLIVEKYKEDSV